MKRILSIAFVASVLLGCGGGGGGGGGGAPTTGSGGNSSPPAQAAPLTDSIPVAPSRGSTLYADATVLRPLRAGATWKYRGSYTPAGVSTPTIYADVITQSAGSNGRVIESASNPMNGGTSTQTLSVSQSNIISVNQSLGAVSYTELRSPVRQNDQYLLFSIHIVDSGIDADVDGVNDSADMAAYSRVVGNETLTIPGLPSVTALRVDTTTLVRLRFSFDSQYSSISQSVQSTWYVSGVGVVRQRIKFPAAAGNDTYDEQLTLWDGVTQGFGAMQPQLVFVPDSVPSYGGWQVRGLHGAVAFNDHIIAAVNAFDPATIDSFYGLYFAIFDLDGNVINAVGHPSIPTSGGFQYMVRTNSGFAEVQQPSAAGQGKFLLFNDQAQLTSSATGVSYDLTSPSLIMQQVSQCKVAGDTTGLWMIWRRMYGVVGVGFRFQIVMREFDTAAQPLTPEFVLADTATSNIGPLSISAANGEAIAVWIDDTGQKQYSAYYQNGVSPVTHALGQNIWGMPLALGAAGKFAIIWSGDYSYVNDSGTVTDTLGVVLDSNGLPVFAQGNSDLSNEIIFSGNTTDVSVITGSGSEGSLVTVGLVHDKLYPEDDMGYLYALSDYASADTALSSQSPAVTKFSMYYTASDDIYPFVFQDRILLLVGNDNWMNSEVVWRKP